jgi:hypothetical protein
MTVGRFFLLNALLHHNYFPAQSMDKEELPPVLHTRGFRYSAFKNLITLPKRAGGYDQVEYKLTRYNNVPRTLSIPHPKAYAHLCNSIFENWKEFQYIMVGKHSVIYPKQHSDGRIIIMNYESSEQQIERQLRHSFGKKFCVNTDITNFYPSIYSHAIPWALVDFKTAKQNQKTKDWFNQIDICQTLVKRNETNGVPIGPATSNIVSEAILARVDEILDKEGFSFYRFIDDYTAYCNTYEDAEKFIRRLSEELSKFKISLNIKKTNIAQLPFATTADWIADLSTRKYEKDQLTTTNVIRFLDYAINKQSSTPDGSVIKYAVKMIFNDVKNNPNSKVDTDLLIKYALSHCIKYPILLPTINILLRRRIGSGYLFENQLSNILDEHATNRCSDAMSWSLYYINKFSVTISKEVAEKVIQSEDCVAILLLYLSKKYDNEVITFCNGLDKCDLFLLDQYWLLLYQLYIDGKIINPYDEKAAYTNHLLGKRDTPDNAMKREIQVFDSLKRHGVSFVS